MCGIIGLVSTRDVSKILLEGLRRLEYRGYDSAGIAVIKDNKINRIRALGKVQVLADATNQKNLFGLTGIAHTRWATHGGPSEINAHPHISGEELAIVHNGIIENYQDLRHKLTALGYKFLSETDTEVAGHLIHYYFKQTNSLVKAVQIAAKEMHGAFAIGVVASSRPDELVAIRQGSPLVLGIGIDEKFIASDTLALKSFAQAVVYLEEGDSVLLKPHQFTIFSANGEIIERAQKPLFNDGQTSMKGNYRHFMLKEIFEQSKVLQDTLDGKISSLNMLFASLGDKAQSLLQQTQQIHIVACGTSYHAGLIAKFWFESLAKIPCQVEIASEFRYRDVVVWDNTLFITVSQSGETADTLAALSKAKKLNYIGNFAICNVASSSIVRESDFTLLTRAGLEIGVASTKAFTTQLTAFLMLVTALCKNEDQALEILRQLQSLPEICDKVLETNHQIQDLSTDFINKTNALFLGRGVEFPVALEGALKLKEVSYIHAEAYPAGELKHGPLALVDNSMPVVVIAANDGLIDKLKSNLSEVVARGGKLYIFADENLSFQFANVKYVKLPAAGEFITPIIHAIALQLLAYHVAVAKGTDVDQPRNLAKSVTVE